MTATLNGTLNSSPDTPSPIYPDRLIRPLPKRTLRSRLSTEAAESILYPPAPPVTQLFCSSCAVDSCDTVNESKVYVRQSFDHESEHQHSEHDNHYPYENGVDFDSADEDGPVVVRRSAGFRGTSLSPSVPCASLHGCAGNIDIAQHKPSLIALDGYDAFENTNNKKKRKIPTPGNLNHSNLSPEFSTMGLSTSSTKLLPGENDGANTVMPSGSSNSSTPAGSGISGSGRGRLRRNPSRNSSGRSPLSVHTANTYLNARMFRRDHLPTSATKGGAFGRSDQGIISTAIAHAAASPTAAKGLGGTSLLDQKATPPEKTQFTFTCESNSFKDMALQLQNPLPPSQPHRSPPVHFPSTQNHRGVVPQGTQTSPGMTHVNQQMQQGAQQSPLPDPAQAAEAGVANNQKKKKKKRSSESIYALAARQRKLQQQYANIHHPPGPDEIWICEFCEYESIFGHPPEALIRQYEIKDRKERRRLAEKRRLLEKAKMKGRKGKKATKNAIKHAAAQRTSHHAHERVSTDIPTVDPHGFHDNCLEDEHDEIPTLLPTSEALPPTPFKGSPSLHGGQAKVATAETALRTKNCIDPGSNPPA